MWSVCDKVWIGAGWSKDWRTGLVIPQITKGEGKKIDEYRGITLMSCRWVLRSMRRFSGIG